MSKIHFWLRQNQRCWDLQSFELSETVYTPGQSGLPLAGTTAQLSPHIERLCQYAVPFRARPVLPIRQHVDRKCTVDILNPKALG